MINGFISRNKRFILVFCATLFLLSGINIGISRAYFTAYTKINGVYNVVYVPPVPTPEENLKPNGKEIAIKNTGERECWGRVKIIAPEGFEVKFDSGENWRQDGEYWYYSEIIYPGKLSSLLKVSFTGPNADEYNVIVIEECVPVLYDKNGKALPADWAYKLPQQG